MDKIDFISEWVEYIDEKDKEEALMYLKLWKKYILRKMGNPKVLTPDQIVHRSVPALDTITFVNTLGIKFGIKRIDA